MTSKFQDRVGELLDQGGIKGYNDALREICQELPHALGEIVYKVVRYHAKGDQQDLVKIAAWAELEWRRVNRQRSGTGNNPEQGSAWASIAGPSERSAYPGAGMFGINARSELYDALAKAVRRVPVRVEPLKGRTGAGGRRRKSVDRKSGHRKGKGRT